jgi:hypothetical protein
VSARAWRHRACCIAVAAHPFAFFVRADVQCRTRRRHVAALHRRQQLRICAHCALLMRVVRNLASKGATEGASAHTHELRRCRRRTSFL